MKLRIEDNSLRLRLSEAEVQQFGQTGRISTTISLGPGSADRLSYALQRQPSDAVGLSYADGEVVVLVPPSLAKKWVDTEQNGFSSVVQVADNQEIRILVEKDLDCRH